jgi:hypothetical protein
MLIAGINMLFFYTTTATATRATPALAQAPLRARVIGTISLTCWLAVIVCGRLITYYRPPYHWCFWCQ